MTCLTLKAHCEASAAAAQECVSGGMLLTRQGMLRAAAAEICLRPPVDYAYTTTYIHTYACIPLLLLLLHPLLASLQSPPLLTHYPLNNGRELQLELCMVNRRPHARQKSVVTYLPFLRLRCGERWHLRVARGSFYNRQLTSGSPTARPALFTILLSLPLHTSPDGSADRQASFHFFALFVFAETFTK